MNEEYPTNPYSNKLKPYSNKVSPYSNKTNPYLNKTTPYTKETLPYGQPATLYPVLLQEVGNTIRTEDGKMIML